MKSQKPKIKEQDFVNYREYDETFCLERLMWVI